MKHPVFSCRTLGIIGAAAAFALSLWLLSAAKEIAPDPPAAQTAGQTPGYYATLVDHQIVIYLNGRAEPVLITEIDARTLPDADRELLENGIQLENAADVNRLLEDYSG